MDFELNREFSIELRIAAGREISYLATMNATIDDRFLTWLAQNIDAVRDERADYNGTVITPETKVVQFRIVFSFIVATVARSSRFYVPGHDPIVLIGIGYSVATLVLGWWGIPWGPLLTIGGVGTNLFGGTRRTVNSLIDELTGHAKDVVTLTPQAAEFSHRQIVQRGFPANTALLVTASSHFQPEFKIQFDLPFSDGQHWRGSSQGLTVMIHKDDVDRFRGLVVDVENDEYAFRIHDVGDDL